MVSGDQGYGNAKVSCMLRDNKSNYQPVSEFLDLLCRKTQNLIDIF